MEDARNDGVEARSEDEGISSNRREGRSHLYSRLSAHDAAFFADVEKAPLVGALSVAEERERMKSAQIDREPDPRLSCTIFNTRECTVYLVRPADLAGDLPITVFLHGGGWVLGEFATHRRLAGDLALRSESVVAFIEYPRAPENRFPVPLDACFGALTELLESAGEHQLDRKRFAFAGDSSGANLAAAMQIKLQESELFQSACMVLLYPPLDASQSTESFREFAENPILGRKTMDWFWEQYVPSDSLRLDPLVSPFYAAKEVLAKFPPTLCITSEYDVLRDECEEFTARLVSAGVDVTAVRWLGMLHAFLTTDALAQSSSGDECLSLVASFLRRNFKKSRE